jgi:hypothetical protein
LPERGKAAVEKAFLEILSPDCINAMAEKLVDESIDKFCAFFNSEFGSSSTIKKCIAAGIAKKKELCHKHIAKVTASNHRIMLNWLQSFSPYASRNIFVEFERALIEAAKNPGFKDQLDSRDIGFDFDPISEWCSRNHLKEAFMCFAQAGSEIYNATKMRGSPGFPSRS